MKYRAGLAVAVTVAMGLVLLVAGSSAQGIWDSFLEEFYEVATAQVLDADGGVLGDVSFFTAEDRIDAIMIVGWFSGLTPGFHGFHIHATGSCDAATERPFTSAGGHLNHAEASHTHGDHNGDLPSLFALETGEAFVMIGTDRATAQSLLDEDGSAIIVHADPDNFGNIPERYGTPDETTLATGDAGARIGCGVVVAAGG
ncbi:MAG: superoxide dismutase family protein [Chloroflexi bacterium]|nr:superoxide dismutase family protein [Chloroflexota bacterium]